MHKDDLPLNTQIADHYERPSVTVDVALFTIVKRCLKVLLIQRREEPQKNYWGLPGGFIRLSESLEEAAVRILETKAGLSEVFLEQLYTFGQPQRDPRSRVITVAYYALVNAERLHKHQLFNLAVPWSGETGGPVNVIHDHAINLAFDHQDILGMAVRRLRGKLNYSPIGFQLLPSTFTLRELQNVHETILNKRLNKDSFRRRMLASKALEATGIYEKGTRFRPAELYKFVEGSAI